MTDPTIPVTISALKKVVVPVVLLLILAAIVLYASAYTVAEGKQAVITQFGRPVGFVQNAGLKFKVPFVQTVHLLEKRLLPCPEERPRS